jgi:uncharacterized cupin superfamily protein
MATFNLSANCIVIDSTLSCTPVAVGPMLYQELDRNFSDFKQCCLVSEHTFEQDWTTWEMHPVGDEVLYLISGRVELLLLENDIERVVGLDKPGTSTIVPKGTWHTARIFETTTILFITPGEGTMNVVDPREPHALA